MDAEVFATLDHAVSVVARKYAARGIGAYFEDLKQQGWVHAARVYRDYPEIFATKPFDATAAHNLVYVSALRNLATYTRRQRAPISGNCPEAFKALGTARRVPLLHSQVRDKQTPEAACAVAEARRKARARFDAQTRDLLDAHVDAAVRVLFQGERPGEVAETTDLPLRVVYDAVKTCVRKLERDAKTQRVLCEALLEAR